MENALDLYKKCLKRKYINKDIPNELIEALYTLVEHAERWIRINWFIGDFNRVRIQVIKLYLPMIKKVIKRDMINEFINNVPLACSMDIDCRAIPQFYNLLFYPFECIREKKENRPSIVIKRDNLYQYTIGVLLLRNEEEKFINRDERLLKDLAYAKEYLRGCDNMDTAGLINRYIPSIISYCYANRLDEKKYHDMLTYLYDNYDRLEDIYEANYDFNHRDELLFLLIHMIANNQNFYDKVIK